MALSLDHEDPQRHLGLPHQSTATAVPESPRARAGAPTTGKPEPIPTRRETGAAREHEKTTAYELLLGDAGEIVGQRARLADEVPRALVVALVEGDAGLIQEFLGGPQRFLLRRLQRASFEVTEGLGHVADALARALEKALLLGGRQFRAQRAGR